MVRAAVNNSLRPRQWPQRPRDISTSEQTIAHRGQAGLVAMASCASQVGQRSGPPPAGSSSARQATQRGGKRMLIAADVEAPSHRRHSGGQSAAVADSAILAVTLAPVAFVLPLFS